MSLEFELVMSFICCHVLIFSFDVFFLLLSFFFFVFLSDLCISFLLLVSVLPYIIVSYTHNIYCCEDKTDPFVVSTLGVACDFHSFKQYCSFHD